MDDPAPKVTIVVPTYCPGDGLTRLIESLDSQSMGQHEFESVFVDDGSPDGTLAMLEALAAQRPNMRVVSIPNSGWPSRPRNVGLDLARGEYVVFMDHDDELYPHGLEDAWAFAHGHDLDALTAKETKSDSPFFAWGAFLRDVVPPENRAPALLRPMMVHKLYRRDYLVRNGIRFREVDGEGGKVQWEDIHFNIDVYDHGGRVGVLASRPFYHLVRGTGSNSSDTFAADPERYWQDLGAVFEHIDDSSIEHADADWIRAANYTWRVLPMLGPAGLRRDEDYFARTLVLARKLIEKRIPPRIDDQLPASARTRSLLLRAERGDLLRSLAHCDRRVHARPVATTVEMVDGSLRVSCTARWSTASGEPLELCREGDRVTRVLPAELTAALPDDVLDWSSHWKDARGDLSVSGRRTGVGWPTPGRHENRLVDLTGDRVALETSTSAVVDPRTAGMGHPLESDQWRLACRSEFAGFDSHPFVTYRGPTLVGLVDGRVVVAHSSKHDHLLLDVTPDARTLLAETSPDVSEATITRDGGAPTLVIPVPLVSTAGSSRLPVTFRLRGLDGQGVVDGEGHLVGDHAGARVELRLGPLGRVARGRHRLIVDGTGESVGDSAGPSGWLTEVVVRVRRGGRFARVSLEQVPVPEQRRRPLWG